MGKEYHEIDERLAGFIHAQPVFFVATAPLGAGGHINLSPKGLAGSFAILGKREVAYADYPGSGIETVAHLRENGRICLMFCAFSGQANILRLYGKGEAVLRQAPDFAALAEKFPDAARLRSIIRVQVERIADSCGYGVPLMDYVRDRDTLIRWIDGKSEEAIKTYLHEKNASSIDGLPGVSGKAG